ncbi:MAG: hypothetical protein ACYDCA_09535 [Candidatus Tyrphobacter sp.]
MNYASETNDAILSKIRELREREAAAHDAAEQITQEALGVMREARRKLYEAQGCASQISALVKELKSRRDQGRSKPPAPNVPEYVAFHRERSTP